MVVADTDDHAVDPALAPPGGDRIGATDDRNAQHGAGRCTTRRPGCAVIDDGDHLEGRTRLGRIDDAGCVARTPDDHHPTHPPTVEHVVRVRPTSKMSHAIRTLISQPSDAAQSPAHESDQEDR